MAILSVDSYLLNEISSSLKGLLANPYIVREVILRDFPDSVANPFITTFCTDKGHQGTEIPVTLSFPQKSNPQAFVLVQFKGGEELTGDEGNSLGGVTGLVDRAAGDVLVEKAVLNIENFNGLPRAWFELSHPISELQSIQGYSGQTQVDGNRIYIQFMEGMDSTALQTTITYSPQNVDHQGNALASDIAVAKGYDLMEGYTIDSVSNNMDTLRCLDAVLKTIFIYMKQNADEQTELRLSTLTFSGVDLIAEINNATNSGFGDQLYYRRTEIHYELTYSLNTSVGNLLKSVHLQNA